MKKILAVLVLSLFAGAASAYVILAPAMKEKGRAAVAAFFDEAPGECSAGGIDVDILTGAVTLTDLRWLAPTELWQGQRPEQWQGRGFELTADEIVLRGVDIEALHRPGRAGLARSVHISGLRTSLPGVLQGSAEQAGEDMRLVDLRLQGLHGDMGGLLRALRPGEASEDEARADLQADLWAARRTALRTALMSFSVDSLTAEGYEKRVRLPEGGSLLCRVKRADVRDMRPLSLGRATWEGVTFVLEGKARLTMARLALDELSVPDFLEPLASPETADVDILAAMLAALEKDKLVLGNMEISDALLERADGETLAAASFFLDLEGTAQEARLTQRGRGISLSAGFFEGREDALERFLRGWGKDLKLESRLDISLRQTGLRGEIELREAFVEDKALGSLRLEGLFAFDAEGEAEPLDAGVALSLRRADISFEDRQALSVYLRSVLDDDGGQTDAGRVDLLRGHMADAFERDVNRAGGPGEAALFRGLAQLARAPGNLRLVLEPPGAVPLDSLLQNFTPDMLEELNISVSYSPAE